MRCQLPRLRSLVVRIATVIGCTAAFGAGGAPLSSVVNSPHNLSAMSPGRIHATSEQQICIFCHTPHNASSTEPLWNRQVPPSAYRPYASTSLQAKPGQPTGASKLCLSCHDGTIALGNIVSRSQPISMAQGMTVIPPGKTNLGTDLSDDHPISFRYDATLVSKNSKLKDPGSLPSSLKLDNHQELQCTTCHDAHDDSRGKFLVMDNNNSQLCKSCHNPGLTTITGHEQCAACHQPHTAPSGPWLLKQAKVVDTCGQCHSGATGTNQGPNVIADISKVSNHDTAPVVNIADHAPNDVTCTDCHGPHSMTTASAAAPNIRGNFGKVRGINAAGAAVAEASYEYEVCFRCHADNQSRQPYIPRVITQVNARLEFSTSAVSSHPVEGVGKNSDVPSLKPGYTTASVIYCSDCHSSDTGHAAGGTGPDGTHGSNISPLLVARYDTIDRTSESATAYALCYNCHERSTILSDSSSGFRYHKKHIQEERTPCSICHDSHGISSAQGTTGHNSHLINFDTRVVTPNSNGLLEYNRTGVRHGTCNLRCHGENHSNESY